ncbi:hypothetical protein Lalb_Chr25g0279551 [Lupinus albus]|uniref:Uncharacterized protein n=1 Tax=Lupinus albus TaxID=3870 RepID=A0A6A4ND60_LUPAL|nr:hypothetical protein Lalb_Chr25g0279551 [Lupinus albus]
MSQDYEFTTEDMVVNESLGYPKAFANLCLHKGFGPYTNGPPFTFTPYALHEDEAERARDLDQIFPIIDPKAKPTTKPKIFASLLWKQLSHLGNAGFDPKVIRVDAYGNVVHYNADSASPLAWDIDHWFPCSRGGLTVVSNLRILQRQVGRRKKNKLEFLIPWWDFQLGISVNQFLSIFASSNSDFRYRAFSFLFSEGENDELNASDFHSFPQHFFELKEQVGFAPAAIVESRHESFDALALRQVDYNRKPRPFSHGIVASSKSKGNLLKENEDPQWPRDSLRQREENARVHAEIQKLENEVNEIRLTNEDEKRIIQDLESTLANRRRKAEQCRRVAEAQCSYRTMLEKMIRDSMHQSAIYKEQIRLNQAASNALMARLEAQREICDAAEKELRKRYKQRDELENEIRHEWEQGRKRLRIEDYGASSSENEEPNQEEKEEDLKITADNIAEEKLEEYNKIVALEEEKSIEHKLQKLEISEVVQETENREDEERRMCGIGNLDNWLERLLENSHEERPEETDENMISGTEEIMKQMNQKYPQKEQKISKVSDHDYKEKQPQLVQDKKKGWIQKEDRIENEARSVIWREHENYTEVVSCINEGNGMTSFEGIERKERHKKEKKIVRSSSARALRRIPSSRSLLSGMRKGYY